MNTNQILKMIYEFNQKNPKLFKHLSLEKEVIFELCNALGKLEKWDEYFKLLKLLRIEQPKMYLQVYGSFDKFIIHHLISMERYHETLNYLDYFRLYCDSFPECIEEIVEIFVWIGLEKQLSVLYASIMKPITGTSDIDYFSDSAPYWFMLNSLKNVFFSIKNKDTNLNENLKLCLEVLYPDWIIIPSVEEVHSQYSWYESFIKFDFQKENYQNNFEVLKWKFTGFLHIDKGFNWLSSCFLAHQLTLYLEKTNFVFSENIEYFFKINLKLYLKSNFSIIFFFNGLKTVSLLQALSFFSDYLESVSIVTNTHATNYRKKLKNTYNSLLERFEGVDPASRLINNFPMTNFLNKS